MDKIIIMIAPETLSRAAEALVERHSRDWFYNRSTGEGRMGYSARAYSTSTYYAPTVSILEERLRHIFDKDDNVLEFIYL